MEINVQLNQGDYHSVVSPRPHARLGAAWRIYHYTVRPRAVGSQHQIAFFLGNRVGSVWLADVSFKKESR
jgi:hypothetical protein